MLHEKVYGILLAGGSGTRLWPLSTPDHPKPFLALTGHHSLLQEAALRLQPLRNLAGLMVVGRGGHEALLQRQLQQIGIDPLRLILEEPPCGTAISIGLGCLAALAEGEAQAMVFVLPADHALIEGMALDLALQQAISQAEAERLVVFGVQPGQPCSAYGYIAQGASRGPCAWDVARFVEKPSQERAQAMLEEGGWLWNSGMLLGQAAVLWHELCHHAPVLAQVAMAAWEKRQGCGSMLHLFLSPPENQPPLSMDHAVLEKTDRAVVVSLETPWSDVGTFAALHELAERDEHGNAMQGPVVALECSGSYLHSAGPVLGVHGVQGMAVVATAEAVLAAPLGNAAAVESLAQRCKHLLERPAAPPGRSVAESQPSLAVRRPWGSFSILAGGVGFQIKRLLVQPKARISLQYHSQRSEWWFVRQGHVRVTLDGEQQDHGAGAMIPVPMGAVHRLENIGTEVLEIIEMQMGDYLGEDDIVRLEDDYGRQESRGQSFKQPSG